MLHFSWRFAAVVTVHAVDPTVRRVCRITQHHVQMLTVMKPLWRQHLPRLPRQLPRVWSGQRLWVVNATCAVPRRTFMPPCAGSSAETANMLALVAVAVPVCCLQVRRQLNERPVG